jgi:hypothetical protein
LNNPHTDSSPEQQVDAAAAQQSVLFNAMMVRVQAIYRAPEVSEYRPL